MRPRVCVHVRYTNIHEAQLFGRGHIAGIDVVTQKKDKSRFYEAMLDDRRTKQEKKQEVKRIEKEAVKAKKSKFDDRHWKRKDLEEMQERDWRILKEDFNIGTRGGFIPNPLRNWKEANLKPELMRILKDLKFVDPSPVQRAAIPIGLQVSELCPMLRLGF